MASALWKAFGNVDTSEQVDEWISDLFLDLYTVAPPAGGDGFMRYAEICLVFAAGDNAGTATAGAWYQYPLNTILADEDGIATLNSNRFQIEAGTFSFHVELPLHAVGATRAMLYNYTANTPVKIGANVFNENTEAFGQDVSNGSDWYELRYWCTTTNPGDGLGRAVNTGGDELYGTIGVWLS